MAFVNNSSNNYPFISQQAAANSATINFVFPTVNPLLISTVEFEIAFVKPITDGADFWMRTSSDGGATYDSAAASYSWNFTTSNDAGGTGVTADASSTHINLQAGLGNAANEWSSYRLKLWLPETAAFQSIKYDATGRNTTGVCRTVTGSAFRLAASKVNAVQFLFDTGNISVGYFEMRVYRFFA